MHNPISLGTALAVLGAATPLCATSYDAPLSLSVIRYIHTVNKNRYAYTEKWNLSSTPFEAIRGLSLGNVMDLSAAVSPIGEVRQDAPRPRRTHAERRAEGSIRIIESTIRCLNRNGYGATTIDAILKESNVTRGRLLHLFPTKVDIMIAVSRHAWENNRRYLMRRTAQYSSPAEQLGAWVDEGWKLMSHPTGMAVLEILMACRSDKALAKRFVPEHKLIQEQATASLTQLIETLPVRIDLDIRAFHHYFEACIRGLCIDRTFSDAPTTPPPALAFLRDEIARWVSVPVA